MFVRGHRRLAGAALAILAVTSVVPPRGPAVHATADRVYVFPVPAGAWFPTGHHDYPATDLMAPCGRRVVSPVDGVVDEVSRVDRWRRSVNDPATRGGRFVSIVGDDGVRYYLAHLRSVDRSVAAGKRVAPGQQIGIVGRSGRAGACHVHFGISPPCPGPEWWVRRGVVSPYPYLRSWKKRVVSSPAPAIAAWRLAHPDACSTPR